MGIGKNISGYGITPIFHPDPVIFAGNLSVALQVNIGAIIFESGEVSLDTDHPYINTVDVFVQKDKNCVWYDVRLPIIHDYEKEFDFSFHANHVFEFFHIPFSSAWHFLIEEILGEYDRAYYVGRHERMLKLYKNVRALYLPLLKGLRCNRLFLSTDAQYNWENNMLYPASPVEPIALK